MARHQRDRFYKYTSAETALKIIESGSVRYSSPRLFNDPFDVQSGLHFDFDIDTLPTKLFERMSSLVMSDTRPTLSADDPYCQAILFMWDQ